MQIIQLSGHNQSLPLPLYISCVPAGFPSPAEDHADIDLDLNDYLISKPASTFFVRASGDSMIKAGIMPGSLLVVDKSIKPVHNKIVIAVVGGEFTVKRLSITKDVYLLMPENSKYPAIELKEDSYIWGVVVAVVNKF